MDDPHFELLRRRFSPHPGSLNPTAPKDLFAKAGGWSGRHGRQARPAEEAKEILEAAPATAEEPAEIKDEVKLMNPRWDRERAFFEETAMASVEAEVPSSCSHLTRIVFSLFALGNDGGREHIADAEGHLREGKAEAGLELKRPRTTGGEGERRYFFTAKHARSEAVQSPPLGAREGSGEFRGMIFYSPSRDEYLMLDDPEAIDYWLKEIELVERLRGHTAQAWEIPDAQRRREKLDEIGEETVKLFGEKGTVAHSKGALDEMLLITDNWNKRKMPSWVFVKPHERRNCAGVKGHWRKRTDKTVQKELDELLAGKAKKPCPWLKAQVRLSLLKQEPKQGEAWRWKRESNDSDGGVSYSAQASALRYALGWDGFEAAFDPRKKRFVANTSAQFTASLLEGEVSGTWMWPHRDGVDLLPFLCCMGYPQQPMAKGKECLLRVSIKASASAFEGISLRGAMTFPFIDWSDGWKKLSASTSLEGSVFAGAQANIGLRVALEWSSSRRVKFETLASISGEYGVSEGVALEGKISIELKKGKFRFRMFGGLAYGLGLREGVMFDTSVAAGYELVSHMCRCIDHKWLDEITEEAFQEFSKYASALLHQGSALASSVERTASFAKACVRESAGLRNVLAGTPPSALAEALETLMRNPEAPDFQSIVLMLNACGPNQLRWTLRHLSGTPVPLPGDPALGPWKDNALASGRRRLLDFAKDVKELADMRGGYVWQVTDVFSRNGI